MGISGGMKESKVRQTPAVRGQRGSVRAAAQYLRYLRRFGGCDAVRAGRRRAVPPAPLRGLRGVPVRLGQLRCAAQQFFFFLLLLLFQPSPPGNQKKKKKKNSPPQNSVIHRECFDFPQNNKKKCRKKRRRSKAGKEFGVRGSAEKWI